MKKFILLTSKSWHKDLFNFLKLRENEDWSIITSKDDFVFSKIKDLNPNKIFIPHWSHIIPSNIFEKFECIVFHMTDLPYGRGGSPLQNLIVRGHQDTMISAIQIDQGVDTGKKKKKKPLSLKGSAKDIFERATVVIQKMILEILSSDINPVPQKGIATIFKRRSAKDGCMNELKEIEEVYDYIRMLDVDNYPPAFIETDSFKIDFFDSKLINETQITANVRITKK